MKGICFIEPLFEKVVNGTKTQTRRIAAAIAFAPDNIEDAAQENDVEEFVRLAALPQGGAPPCKAPYAVANPRYKVGETLYLKEPYAVAGDEVYYRYLTPVGKVGGGTGNGTWFRNKLFMPEERARYFIRVTDVRGERLQDISRADCFKEGICREPKQISIGYPLRVPFPYFDGVTKLSTGEAAHYTSPREAYAALIDHINGKGVWASNPRVFVYDFVMVNG
jgi:hypothetical protein